MSEFKREERFIVVKLKTMDAYQKRCMRDFLSAMEIRTCECVVVESDWPEYEQVWEMIAARVEGRPTPYQVLEQQVAALRQHKNDYMDAAEGTRRAFNSELEKKGLLLSEMHEALSVADNRIEAAKAEAQALREEVAALRLELGGMQMEMVEVAYRLSPALLTELKRLVAFAYDQGIEGAEEVGRQLEGLMGQEALRARFVVPDGYALVPVEPTREMFIAVNKEDDKAYAGACDHGAPFDWLWQAAIDAAPRLNSKAVSEGLLLGLVQVIEKYTHDARVPNEVSQELATELILAKRALLDEGKEDGDVLVRE